MWGFERAFQLDMAGEMIIRELVDSLCRDDEDMPTYTRKNPSIEDESLFRYLIMA